MLQSRKRSLDQLENRLTFILECFVPINTMLFMEMWIPSGLQRMKWIRLVVEFSLSDLVSGPMNVDYSIWMTYGYLARP